MKLKHFNLLPQIKWASVSSTGKINEKVPNICLFFEKMKTTPANDSGDCILCVFLSGREVDRTGFDWSIAVLLGFRTAAISTGSGTLWVDNEALWDMWAFDGDGQWLDIVQEDCGEG